MAVVDGFRRDLVSGLVWLDGLGQLVWVEGQRNPLHLPPLILGFRSCRKTHLLSREEHPNAP